MSQDWFADVLEFHRKFEVYIGATPSIPPENVRVLRTCLEDEEKLELIRACYAKDLPGIADGIADLIYVLLGRAIAYGIDLRPIWDEVQRANMAKVGGPLRGDGKKLKPPGWTPPNIVGVLSRQESIL